MTLPLSTVQGGAAMALATRVLPHLSLPYALGTAGAAAGLLAFMAQDSDRAAQRRVDEIKGMQAIFAAFAGALADNPTELSNQALHHAEQSITSVNLTNLDQHRCKDLPLLVAIHAYVEGVEASWARALEHQILTHLNITAQGRALVILG